jgi:FeS assembly SUF system protein
MNQIEKKNTMEKGVMHHTIDAPRVGAAGSQGVHPAVPGDDKNVNPGFEMQQPHELAPRDPIAPPAALPSGGDKPAAPGVVDGGTAVPGSALSREQLEQMTDDIIAALKTVYDPEIPADIYELGLIYKVDIKDARDVEIDMTLTAPACPVAGEMPQWVENAVRAVAGIGDVTVNLVFEPAWEPSRMSDEARLALNMF